MGGAFRHRISSQIYPRGKRFILGEDGNIDITKLRPIIFDGVHAAYHEIGETIGGTFTDDAQLK